MASQVTVICPHERVWLDPNRIGRLYVEMGGTEVQALLDRAMCEMDAIHREMAALYEARDITGFARQLRSMRRITEHLGLTTVSRISEDVLDCLERDDATALAATWARLSRTATQACLGAWCQS